MGHSIKTFDPTMKSLSLICLIPFVAAYASQALTFKAANLDPRNNLKTVDIIADTRSLSNHVQATLRKLAADPASAEIVNRIINDKDNICLGNLEDGIAGIETATKLLERAGGDIKKLIAKVNSIGDLTEPASAV